MSKLWNFLFFQAGWFACVLGAAHQQVFWAVTGSLAYIAFHKSFAIYFFLPCIPQIYLKKVT